MSFVCYMCNASFTRNSSLKTHLNNKKSHSIFTDDLNKLNLIHKELKELKEMNEIKDTNKNIKNKKEEKEEIKKKEIKEEIKIINKIDDKIITNTTIQHIINHNEHQKINIINQIVNINITVNPITKLNTKYLNSDTLKNMIYSYDDLTPKTPQKLKLLLTNYIKDLICNKKYPENHVVKYTRIRPPTYNCKIEDENGTTISVIKGLSDTCDLLTDPILLSFKRKIRQFLYKYEKDDKDDFDYGLYDTAIEQLRKEFNNENVKKALCCVLQNEILNDIKMKI